MYVIIKCENSAVSSRYSWHEIEGNFIKEVKEDEI